MKILLVYPQYPDTFWSFKRALKFVSRKSAFPPLGLLTVAAMLPKKWKKKLVDVNVGPLKDEDIAWADMVFISAMVVQNSSAQEIIDRCKVLGKTIVAGGPSFTTLHKSFKNVDHFVLNEAEVTLPKFLKDFAKGHPKRVYTSKIKPDIAKTPIPLWPLINIRDYQSMAVQYSRGCPFNCEFCDIVIMNGRVPRTKTPGQIIAELRSLYNIGWRGGVFIVDDNFIGNKTRVKKMLPYLIRWQKKNRYPFAFTTEASVNLAEDEDLMQKMSEANFCKVFLGIETTDTESLVECGKYQNTKGDLADAVKRIQSYGLQVMAGFIVGFDHDNESVFERQIKFIQQTGIVVAMTGLLTAAPKTRLWQRLKLEGRLLKLSSGENTDGTINFIPKMGREKLLEGYKKIINTVYSPKLYYERIDNFLKTFKPTVRGKLYARDIRAFFKSVVQIGIFSRQRFLYWRLLIKTFFTRIRNLPTAIEFSVMGEHFKAIAKRISETESSPHNA